MPKLKTYLTISAIIISVDVFGQDYIPFPEDSAKWCLEITCNVNEFGINAVTEGRTISVTGDTIINGLVYSNLVMIRTWSFETYLWVITDYDNDDIILGNIGAIRNDSQKLYFYKYDNDVFDLADLQDTIDILLYDFSKGVGDTIYYPDVGDVGPITDVIMSIDTIILGDSIKRRIFEVNSNLEVVNYIEGIGETIEGLFAPYIVSFEGCFIDFDCYWEKGKYLLGADSCDYYELYDEIDNSFIKNTITISPNPFTNKLIISNLPSNNNYEIKIYNILGEMCLTKKINTATKEINTAQLQNGLYILVIEDEGIQIQTQKIIKL